MDPRDLFLFDIPNDPLSGIVTTTAVGRRAAPDLRPLTEGGSEFIVFGESSLGPSREDLYAAMSQLQQNHEASAALILRCHGADSRTLEWRTLPLPVARLLDCPTSVGWLVTRRAATRGESGVRDAAEPLWEWFGRLCERSGVIILETTVPEHAGSSEAARAEIAPPLQPLVPKHPGDVPSWLRQRLHSVISELTKSPSPERTALTAGLLLWHDFLDESHSQSQTIEGDGKNRDGDYWHAIMHRREPDYTNSKYWFRQVGRHPTFSSLGRAAESILNSLHGAAAGPWESRLLAGGWNPHAFVDLCESCRHDEDSDLAVATRRIQRAEMLLLLRQTCADAGLAVAN